MATLSELQTRVQQTIGLKTSGTELTLLTGWLNEGYEDVLARTRCYVNCSEVALDEGAWKHRLSAASLAVLEVWIDGEAPFERVTTKDIIDMRRADSAMDDGLRYYSTEGANLILTYPNAGANQELNILYVPRPTALSGASDTPSFIPAQWHRALELYASWRAANYDDDGSSQVGELYRAQYEGPDGRGGILREIRQQNKWAGGRSIAPTRLGRRRRVYALPDRDY